MQRIPVRQTPFIEQDVCIRIFETCERTKGHDIVAVCMAYCQ
jgi:hypothetical protein